MDADPVTDVATDAAAAANIIWPSAGTTQSPQVAQARQAKHVAHAAHPQQPAVSTMDESMVSVTFLESNVLLS